ncbi:peptidyl-prolyl cis-trans isomerase [Nonlabens ulvanivorans]|nr:peptidylprolyl isomerase [Nonlabens ulvanivorans]GAK88855.1 peptidyl-prolyl cis-trans isomerase [Nonlabens ulvanivorans]GAK93336.1 peptidyl-prolyl cis-trans isomerase [Nonlabens ulvanivorans]
MKSKGLFFILVILFTLSCKDSSQKETPVIDKVEETRTKEQILKERKENEIAKFYKRTLNRKGDTLLPYIPQDSVEVFFTRYGKEHPETKVLMTTTYGDIEMDLFEETPLYRASFLFLINNGYFDETVVHRAVMGFIVQAGNSDNMITAQKKGSAGNYQLPMHILPDVKHAYGTLSSAKYWENNPENWHNPFDFFISLRATEHLDGEHTIFGRVTKGMEVAEAISKVETDSRDWPKNDIYIEMIILK